MIVNKKTPWDDQDSDWSEKPHLRSGNTPQKPGGFGALEKAELWSRTDRPLLWSSSVI